MYAFFISTGWRPPGHLGLQGGGKLLVHKSPKLVPVGEVGVEDTVSGSVTKPEVVLCNGGLGEIDLVL